MDHTLRAVLEQIESSGDLRDPDSTKYAKTALITRASRRGLIAWSRRRARYELTAAGRKRLARARAGKGTWSISAKSAKMIGMTVAAGVLGAMVFYAGAFHQMFRGPTPASATVPTAAEAEPSATPQPVAAEAATAPAQPSSPQGRDAQPARVEEPVRSAAAPSAPAPAAAVPTAPATVAPQSVAAAPAASVPAIPSAPPVQATGAEPAAAPAAASPASPSPPVAAGAESVPATADPAAATVSPDPVPPAGHRKRQHARQHHHKRNDFREAFASFQRLFAPPPKHSRRRY